MAVKIMQSESNTEVRSTLDERGSRYGDYLDNANLTQDLYHIIARQNDNLRPFELETIHMVCHKCARILCGDPNYLDNYVDINGYIQLMLDILSRDDIQDCIEADLTRLPWNTNKLGIDLNLNWPIDAINKHFTASKKSTRLKTHIASILRYATKYVISGRKNYLTLCISHVDKMMVDIQLGNTYD